MADVLAAFVVVFLAELGDKTQLVALTLAGRHPAAKVMLSLGAAIAVLQTLSVTVGALVSAAVPDRAIAVGAGVLFLGFAVWTWRSADEEDDDDVPGARNVGLYSVAVAFFLPSSATRPCSRQPGSPPIAGPCRCGSGRSGR